MPLRDGYANEVYIVTSGEMMSLYAATNISGAVKRLSGIGYAKLSGIILNAKGIAEEISRVEEAALEMDTNIVTYIPRDESVQIAENEGKTVVEHFGLNGMGLVYKDLAGKILDKNVVKIAI